MVPIFTPSGPFNITINYIDGVERQACIGFKLFERPNSLPEERYHLEWFNVLRNRKEAYVACSYARSPDGRTYTIINELQYSFIFESKMFQT